MHKNKRISHYINTSVFLMVFKECNVSKIPYPTYCRQLDHQIPFKDWWSCSLRPWHCSFFLCFYSYCIHLFQMALIKEHNPEFLGLRRCLYFCKMQSHIKIYIKMWVCIKFCSVRWLFSSDLLHPTCFPAQTWTLQVKIFFPVARMAKTTGTENSGYCRPTVTSTMKRLILFPFSKIFYLLLKSSVVVTEH